MGLHCLQMAVFQLKEETLPNIICFCLPCQLVSTLQRKTLLLRSGFFPSRADAFSEGVQFSRKLKGSQKLSPFVIMVESLTGVQHPLNSMFRNLVLQKLHVIILTLG